MKNKLSIVGMVCAATMLLTSCLKDDAITDYTDKSIKPVVLVPNGNWPSTRAAAPIALDFSTTPYEVRVYARVSWSKPLGKSLEVTFKEDDAAIANFNTKFGSNWVKMNTSAYSIPAFKVTIPADQNEAYIPVKVFPDKVDLTKFNMLAFTMTDASGEAIAANFQTILVPILIKNIYEANYNISGYFFHPSSPRSIGGTKYFSTINGNRVQGQLGDLGGWTFRVDISGSGALTNFEGTGTTATTVVNGFMTADNPGGVVFPGPAFPGTAPWVHSTYNNSYNAATKSFFIHYGYNAAAGTSQNDFTRQMYEKWTRQ